MVAEANVPLLEGRGGATPAQTIGNIVVSIVGTGVLGLPYAFRAAGWLAGALAVAGAGAATFYCMLLLLECRDKLREQEAESSEENGHQHRCCNYTYGDLGEKCFGRVGRYFTEATIILSQTGGIVAYLVFIGQNISSVFAADDGHAPPLAPATVVLAVLLPVQAALSFIRSLSSLAHFSILADACAVLAVATVVKQDLQLLAARGAPPLAGRAAVAGPWGVSFACGFAVFCFEGFCMTLALEASMSDRSKFRPVLLQAIVGVTVVYACFGACGYLSYGDATKDIVTLNLPSNWSTAAVKVVLCIALALTFPIMMHPIHEIVEARLFAPGGWVRKRCGGVERAALHDKTASQWWRRCRRSRASCRRSGPSRRSWGARCARCSPSCCPRCSTSASWPARAPRSAPWTGATSCSGSRSPPTGCTRSCRDTDQLDGADARHGAGPQAMPAAPHERARTLPATKKKRKERDYSGRALLLGYLGLCHKALAHMSVRPKKIT